MVEYGHGYLGDAVSEAEKLRADSKLRSMMADYMTMRDACRALAVQP